jgi:hypothetical protein
MLSTNEELRRISFMITIMQRVRGYFAKREAMLKDRRAKRFYHKMWKHYKRVKHLKKPEVTMKITTPNGTETVVYRGVSLKLNFPELKKEDGKIHLADGSVVELTNPKQKGSLEVHF